MAGVKGANETFWLMLSIIPLSIIRNRSLYLEEYAKNNKFTQFVKINIPIWPRCTISCIWVIRLHLFVGGAGLNLRMGNSILAAALTMTLLILPIILKSEAIRAVPNSVREACYRWC